MKIHPTYSFSDRPSWDEYFIYNAFGIATRSDDLFIKHGAIIVHNDSQHIIGTGYNNSIAGLPTEILQPTDREARRDRMKHAEDNAIKNCREHPKHTSSECTIYVTGIPCLFCLEDIINYGITRIVGIDRLSTITNTTDTDILRDKILASYRGKVRFDLIPIDNKWVQKGLKSLVEF